MPWQNRYAGFTDGKWLVRDSLPDGWPPAVAEIMNVRGILALSDSGERWYIFYRQKTGRGSGLFLYNDQNEYAVREGGPARCD